MGFSSVYRRRAEEAVETLFSFRPLDPFVRDFPRRHSGGKISPTLNEKNLRFQILQALVGEHFDGARVELETLTDYTDELQEHGHLHVFLLRVPDAADLAKLADAGRLQRRLRERNLADRFDRSYWVWRARDGPKLAGLWLEPGRSLRLKWVETRSWTAVAEGLPVEHARRAVSFFHLDLATGDAELRIQKLHGNAQQLRLDARNTYLGLAGDLLGYEGFEPVSLAPTIRDALTARADETLRDDVEVVAMEVILPEGGTWTGDADDVCPVHPRDLAEVVSLRYKRRRIRDPAGQVTVTLDAALDEIQVFASCTADDFESLLHVVREAAWSAPGPASPEPPSPDEEGPGRGDDGTESEPLPPDDEPPFARVVRLVKETAHPEPPPERPTLERPELDEARRKLAQTAREGSLKQLYDYSVEIAASFHLSYTRECERLRKDERGLFVLFLASVGIGLLIVLAGAAAFLVFDAPVIGGVSALVAALNAVFSVQLHSHQKRLERRRDDLDQRLDETQALVKAIHGTEAIPDPELRAKKIVDLAEMLIQRAA